MLSIYLWYTQNDNHGTRTHSFHKFHRWSIELCTTVVLLWLGLYTSPKWLKSINEITIVFMNVLLCWSSVLHVFNECPRVCWSWVGITCSEDLGSFSYNDVWVIRVRVNDQSDNVNEVLIKSLSLVLRLDLKIGDTVDCWYTFDVSVSVPLVEW